MTVEVRKTYKLYIGGGFPRSESGRSYEASDHTGAFLANAVRASRKDLRDAVTAARKVSADWAAITGYNRGQILYRVAEIMESRRDELIGEIARAQGKRGAAAQVDAAIDEWVYYAGWTDKVPQVMGGLNPVAGPYFNLTSPEPIGVIGILAPEEPALGGLVQRLAPALCAGNAVVAVASERHPLAAIALAECLATSDVPGGVVNILTGHRWELAPVLASHLDVDAIDLTGAPADQVGELESAAAGNVKRIIRASARRGPYEVTAFQEMKTVWHPKGA